MREQDPKDDVLMAAAQEVDLSAVPLPYAN
jgi:hypothetical protein